jgi:hypothetical protein
VRLTTSTSWPLRALGACAFFAAVLAVFLDASDWGQTWLLLLCIATGLASGRWWSITLAAAVVPVAAIAFAISPGNGDSVSDPYSAARFSGFVVLPMAAVIAVGVVIGRIEVARGTRARAPG